MKKSISLLLALLLVMSMMPLAVAGGIDSFDPVKALEQQSVWNYVNEFGSLAVEGQIFYVPTDGEGESDEVTVSCRYYYDPDNDNPAYVSEQSSNDYYMIQYFECYPKPICGSYIYDMATEENTMTVDELDVDGLVNSWNNNIGGFDLSAAELKYSEENDGEYVFAYDVKVRSSSFTLTQ